MMPLAFETPSTASWPAKDSMCSPPAIASAKVAYSELGYRQPGDAVLPSQLFPSTCNAAHQVQKRLPESTLGEKDRRLPQQHAILNCPFAERPRPVFHLDISMNGRPPFDGRTHSE